MRAPNVNAPSEWLALGGYIDLVNHLDSAHCANQRKLDLKADQKSNFKALIFEQRSGLCVNIFTRPLRFAAILELNKISSSSKELLSYPFRKPTGISIFRERIEIPSDEGHEQSQLIKLNMFYLS